MHLPVLQLTGDLGRSEVRGHVPRVPLDGNIIAQLRDRVVGATGFASASATGRLTLPDSCKAATGRTQATARRESNASPGSSRSRRTSVETVAEPESGRTTFPLPPI